MKMHDDLMSSMELSEHMLELTACADVSKDASSAMVKNGTNNDNNNKHLKTSDNINNDISRHSDGEDNNSDDDDGKEQSDNETNEIIAHKNGKESVDDVPIKEQITSEITQINEESDIKAEDIESYIPIDGCIQPEYIPPEDRELRYTNHLQFIRQVMSKYIFRFRASAPFQHPVNAITLKIPHYYKVITNPMDLGTIKKRLDHLWYRSSAECFDDIKLMFDNCYHFNRPEDYAYNSGKKLELYIDQKLSEIKMIPEIEIPCPVRPKIDTSAKVSLTNVKQKSDIGDDAQHIAIADSSTDVTSPASGRVVTRSDHGLLAKRPNKDLPIPISMSNPHPQLKKVPLTRSQRQCLDIVKEMMSKKHLEYAWPFYEPVDVKLFPDYLNVIKKPMDLSSIKTKVETGQYRTVHKFAADIRLMFGNCLRYNPPDIPVVENARKLREFFEFRFAKIPDELLDEISESRHHHHHHHHHQEKRDEKVRDKLSVSSSGITIPQFESESGPNEARMRILEDQVKLLTNAIGSVLNQTPSSMLNGEKRKKVPQKKKRQRSTQGQGSNATGQRKKRKTPSPIKKTEEFDDDDSDDDDDDIAVPITPVATVLSPESFGFEEMAQLKTDLEQLDADSLRRVLKILQASEPSIRCDEDNDNELEIDFEVLKTSTLIELRKYVSSCMLNNSAKKSITNGSESKKKKTHSSSIKNRAKNCDNNPNSGPIVPNQMMSPLRLSESSSDGDSSDGSSSGDESE